MPRPPDGFGTSNSRSSRLGCRTRAPNSMGVVNGTDTPRSTKVVGSYGRSIECGVMRCRMRISYEKLFRPTGVDPDGWTSSGVGWASAHQR
jgi:hypothetical protein